MILDLPFGFPINNIISLFQRLYLVSGLRNIALFVIMPSATTSTPLALHLRFHLRAIFSRLPLNFFSSTIRQEIWPSPGTLRPVSCDSIF